MTATGPLATFGIMTVMRSENRHWRATSRIVIGLALLLSSATTQGLSCAARAFTLADAYEAASSIIVGQIIECEEEVSPDFWANGGANCAFSTLEVLKDSEPARDYSAVASSSGCGLSLYVGAQYLLFLDSENRPLHFSAPLSGDSFQAKLSSRYLKIVRDFRDGIADDLAEPWTFGEQMGQCAVSQYVRGNSISFHVRGAGPPEVPAPSWTKDSIDGHTVYRASVAFYDQDTKAPSGAAELIAYGEAPDHNSDDMILRVRMTEKQPPAIRDATITVGETTWPLLRLETIVNLSDALKHTMVQYYATGQTAEQVLSAMKSPSDIVVSATIAESNASDPEPEVSSPNQPSFGVLSSNDSHIGPTVPEISTMNSKQESIENAKRRYQPKQELPEPVLFFDSRSTQILGVLSQFESCHEKGR